MTVDESWMRRALLLARKGEGNVHPNPMVGAVLVRRGRWVSSGFHHRYGGPHAEVEAIRKAGTRARGSTLYVTLEPCSHWGKTPPCAEAVIAAGVKRVVVAMKDPNPLVSGRGFRKLRAHHIAVESGVLESEARALNRAFILRIQKGRPYVTLKVAASLDGRTATVTGESKWITGSDSRREGYQWRSKVDAIAVGAGTVLRDNPSLTSHGMGRNPVRVIFKGRRPLRKASRVFDKSAPTWVFQGSRDPSVLRKQLKELSRKGITHLLVEGGRTLRQSFLDAGVVDEVIWFIAPIIIGEEKKLARAWRLQGARDVCVHGMVKR